MTWRTHVSQDETKSKCRKFHDLESKERGHERKGKLEWLVFVHDTEEGHGRLTKTIVMMVKSKIAFPWLDVSSAWCL
jgi:hypothetical protein